MVVVACKNREGVALSSVQRHNGDEILRVAQCRETDASMTVLEIQGVKS